MNNREAKLDEINEENSRLASELDKYTNLYRKEKSDHEALQATYKEFF